MSNTRELQRIERIKFITEVFKKNNDIDEFRLKCEIMAKYGIAERTAKEYIMVAKECR